MQKLIITLKLILLMLVLSQAAWAFELKQSCSGRGYLVGSSGNVPISFVSVQSFHFTGSASQKFDSFSQTESVNGVICQYSLDTTQPATATLNPDGTGTATLSAVGAAGNPTSCAASFTAHSSFAATAAGSKFISTDPGTVIDAECVGQ